MNPARYLISAGIALVFGLRPAVNAQSPGQSATVGVASVGVAPTLVSHVPPAYPQIAQSAQVEGLVELSATISAEGRVTDVRVNLSQPLLDQAAIDAFRQWRYAPTSGPPATVIVAFRFSLNQPSRYPRPAIYREPLPSWIPENFAFVYKYQCGRTAVEIDSIDRTVTNADGSPPAARSLAFGFDREQASEVFTMLVSAGFFDRASDHEHDSYSEGVRSTWREVGPVDPGIELAADRITTTISTNAPDSIVNDRVVTMSLVDLVTWGIAWRASFDVRVMPPPPIRVLHTLRVRRGDRWMETRWVEPPYRRPPAHVKELVIAGKRIRAFVNRNLVAAAARPGCL